jgi:2-oxoglutarate dehydrogenase complex dehydrogenase (E1) component-like enzyme
MFRTNIIAFAASFLLAATSAATQPSKSPTQPATQPRMVNVFQNPSQVPWFYNQDVRTNIKLNDDQFNRLNKAYLDAYGGYQKAVSDLSPSLTNDQRITRTNELARDFYANFNNTAGGIIGPDQRTRYNQLWLQYQGPQVFADPTVMGKLSLTPEQRNKFNRWNQDWMNEMNVISAKYATDPKAANTQFNNLWKTNNDRVNAILNDQQRQTWNELTGNAFNFPVNAYFQSQPK